MTKAISLFLLRDNIQVWILIPIGFLAVIPATLIEPESTRSVTTFFTWFAIKGLALGLFVVIINFSILRFSFESRARNTVLIGIVGFVSGVVLSLGTQFAADVMGIAQTRNLLAKGLSGGIFISLWVILIFISNDSFSKLSERRDAILSDFFEIDRTTTSENAFLNTLKEGYSRNIQEETNSISSGIESALTGAQASQLDDRQFLRLIDKQLADLDVLIQRIKELESSFISRKFSTSPSLKKEARALIRFIRISARKEVVSPLFLSSTVSASLMWPALRIDGLEFIWRPLSLLGFIIFITQSAIRRASIVVSDSLLNIVSVLITSLSALAALTLLQNKIIADSARGNLVRFTVMVAIVSVLTTLFHLNRGLLFDAAETLDESDRIYAESKVSAAHIRSEISKITANWLQHVHGNIKPRLYAASLTIQKTTASGEPDEYVLALNTAREFLVGFEYADNATSKTRQEELAFRVDRWGGIVEIDVIDDRMNYESCRLSAIELADLIEEGISNAVRHGKCKKISISLLSTKLEGSRIEIRDDGAGFTATAPGLGSSFFDTLTAGNWHRERDLSSQSTVLTLRINP